MKEFNLSGSVTISVYTTAFGDDRLHLHNWVNDEYDGEVQDIEES